MPKGERERKGEGRGEPKRAREQEQIRSVQDLAELLAAKADD